MDTAEEDQSPPQAITQDVSNGQKAPHPEYEAIEKDIRYGSSSDVRSITKQSPDFFSQDVFQMVLHNPTTSHQLMKFSQSRFCAENIDFLDRVDKYNKLLNDLAKTTAEIYHSFISANAASQIGLPHTIMNQVVSDIKVHFKTTLPQMESIFQDAQYYIENMVFTDIYPRFVKYKMSMSAVKALGGDRREYQGLGDCFCLTDPSKADNPITFASDGFVKVTGYQRSEIIPRNCRFLQGRHTDRAPVQRIRAAVQGREESVELLLNYRKTGDPFWNLLYVAPLYNEQKKVEFFIGGQINCSTTIHSHVDIMRILSQSEDLEEDKDKANKQARNAHPGGKLNLLRAFRSQHDTSIRNAGHEAGMENGLLNRIERMDLTTQMNMFYTAYSKYLVFTYDNFVIQYYSSGVVDMLDPTNLAKGPLVGSEVFKFLARHVNNLSRDYKSRVKAALKAGMAISIDSQLFTRRSMIFHGVEKFATHWTPLKDEQSRVKWVVITLGSTLRV